eukprot:3312428-Lingulodinium_polyedra.AAC.1
MQVLEKLINNLGKKHEEFTFRWNQIKYAPEGRCPTAEYVKAYQSCVQEDLRVLEAYKLVAKNRKPKDTTDELHVNLANASAKEAPDKTKDHTARKNFQAYGKCKYGDRYKFAHVEGSKTKPKQQNETTNDKTGDGNINGICKYFSKGH